MNNAIAAQRMHANKDAVFFKRASLLTLLESKSDAIQNARRNQKSKKGRLSLSPSTQLAAPEDLMTQQLAFCLKRLMAKGTQNWF